MPSFRCKIKKLRFQGILTDKETNRILVALDKAEKTAEWIFYIADKYGNDGNEEKWCKCSNCGYKEFYLPPKRSICPNCKERMKEV